MKNPLNEQLPQARHERLIVKELPDEALVYDLDNDKAHCLNNTAALVWKNCDGQTSVEDIAASVGLEMGTSIDERVVWLALDQLEKFNLLESAPTKPTNLVGMTRRQLVRSIGVASLALPVILSMTAPIAAQVVSCPTGGGGRPPGCPCSGGGNCTSSVCCPDSPPAQPPNTLCGPLGRPTGTCL